MNISHKDIYTYVASLLKPVTKNIYRIEIPVTLGSDAIANGFIVLRLNGIRDFSEIPLETYATTRVYVEYYCPSVNTETAGGIMDTTKFDAAQKAIDDIINAECAKTNQTYTISRDATLSTDDFYSNKTNSFFVYVTSFLIMI
ncbi:MAG: hypothetical protein PHN55_09005 [Dysgonamonadaceae bacterium]|nr:hypothetical protein [Dysgonamonadaceae bacterium]